VKELGGQILTKLHRKYTILVHGITIPDTNLQFVCIGTLYFWEIYD